MITYNNIVSKFEQFVDAHFFVRTFSHGSPGDVDLDKLETYPLLHLVYTGGGYADNTKTYNLEVYILDNPPREGDKVEFQKATITQCEQAAEDILADIQNGGNIFQFGYDYDLLSANITPLEDERSNILAGSLLTLSIGVRYQYDSCNAPLTGVEPEGTPPQPFKARGLLRVREVDGDPDVLSVATINVPDGSLTDDGDGEITLTFGGGGDADTAEKLHFPVRNDEGATIPAGAPLYSRGEIGGSERILVGIADASDPAKMPAIGIAETELTTTGSGKDGFAIMAGTYNTNLSGFINLQVNDVLYVQASGSGQLSQAKPADATDLVQNVGVVLKTNGSICQGLKVSCIGRTNDLPNIAPGKFFIGDGSNRAVASTYAFPTTEPNDGDILVYNDLFDRFEAQPDVPTTGQISTYNIVSTNVRNAAPGVTTIDFGSIGETTVTQTNRTGWSMGVNSVTAATAFNAMPTATGATFTVTLEIEVRVPAGSIAQIIPSSQSGYFTQVGGSAAIIGTGSYEDVTFTDTANDVSIWQLTNSLSFSLQNFATSNAQYRNANLTIAMTHA
jgi:hypothetical protein